MAKIIGPGSLLTRYQAGEHEAVWADMMALGLQVREPPYADDAWAVARETMRRARQNVETIIRRLDTIGYQFWDGQQGARGPQTLALSLGGKTLEFASIDAMVAGALGRDPSRIGDAGMRQHVEQVHGGLLRALGLFKVQQAQTAVRREKKAKIADHLKDASVFSPPTQEETAFVRELETKGMFLPLSLRAWAEEIGSVNLAGAHPALSFWRDERFPGVYADPLMVGIDQCMFELEGWVEEAESGEEPAALEAVVGWDAEAKARLAVENEQLDYGYAIELPNAAADAILKGEAHNTTFVDYLRIAFRWGGFPGWERHQDRPETELKLLADGLLPI